LWQCYFTALSEEGAEVPEWLLVEAKFHGTVGGEQITVGDIPDVVDDPAPVSDHANILIVQWLIIRLREAGWAACFWPGLINYTDVAWAHVEIGDGSSKILSPYPRVPSTVQLVT
jgi:hypothetical protein